MAKKTDSQMQYDDNLDWFQEELQFLGLYPVGDEWIDHKFGPRTREGAEHILDGYRQYLKTPQIPMVVPFVIGFGLGMLGISFFY